MPAALRAVSTPSLNGINTVVLMLEAAPLALARLLPCVTPDQIQRAISWEILSDGIITEGDIITTTLD